MIDVSKHVTLSSKAADDARKTHQTFATDFATLTGGTPASAGGSNILSGALPQPKAAQVTTQKAAEKTAPLHPALASLVMQYSSVALHVATYVRHRQDREAAGRPIPIAISDMAAAWKVTDATARVLLDDAVRVGLVRQSTSAMGLPLFSVPLPGAR